MYRNIILLVLVFLTLVGCQSEQSMPGSDQSEEITEVQVSNFEELGSMNEDFKQSFSEKDEIELFRTAIEEAKQQEESSITTYDYDIKLTLQGGGNKGIHLKKNDDDEIIMKYIGDSTKTYIVNRENSKDLINLVYE
ncbi:hypothetical protein RVS70_01955 [Virgibacillus sp. M23]|uniref:hypothetical protein n=1 Tax=Virgibacillus sp. M23 TaxID=3079030 RepID=UPI002A908AB4|nr:hypothetical protein [Virgibacillus sp. M23]MDY7042963.1 hypothetical protein [Virgibacillus sp. M23]